MVCARIEPGQRDMNQGLPLAHFWARPWVANRDIATEYFVQSTWNRASSFPQFYALRIKPCHVKNYPQTLGNIRAWIRPTTWAALTNT